MRTRRERGELLRLGDQDFVNLRNELIHEEVVDLAVEIHGVLSVTSKKYSDDAIIDLIPEITNLLNKYDAALKVNADLKKNLIEIHEENQKLKTLLETEKKRRQLNLEDSLFSEEKAEEEILLLKHKIENMEACQATLHEEIDAKNTIIAMLRADLGTHSCKVPNSEKEFVYPKKRLVTSKRNHTEHSPLQLQNAFSILSQESISAPSEVVTRAQVHRTPATQPSLLTSTPLNPRPVRNQQDTKKPKEENTTKRKVLLLTDSQGKEMHKYMQDLEEKYDVFVYSVPGAKIKNITEMGLGFAKNFTAHDAIIVLAGSNDVNLNEPAQLTITQGIKSILSTNQTTNILINQIPYRYDDYRLNNNIFFYNQSISKLVRDYEGPLNVFCDDINSILGRSHFTRRGLHYSRLGKSLLGKRFTDYVRNLGLQTSLIQPSSPAVEPQPTDRSEPTVPCPVKTVRNQGPEMLDAIETFPETTPVVPSADSTLPQTLITLDEVYSLNCSSFYTQNFPNLPTPKSYHNSVFLAKHPDLNLNKSI